LPIFLFPSFWLPEIRQEDLSMKVQKFVQIPDPGYPSRHQLALLGVAVIGLGGMAMAADDAPVVKGKIRAGPAASAPAKPEPKPQIDGGIRVEPKPAPPPKADPPRLAGEIRAEPLPPPPPAPAK
jgi:hypothetical protein